MAGRGSKHRSRYGANVRRARRIEISMVSADGKRLDPAPLKKGGGMKTFHSPREIARRAGVSVSVHLRNLEWARHAMGGPKPATKSS